MDLSNWVGAAVSIRFPEPPRERAGRIVALIANPAEDGPDRVAGNRRMARVPEAMGLRLRADALRSRITTKAKTEADSLRE